MYSLFLFYVEKISKIDLSHDSSGYSLTILSRKRNTTLSYTI